MDDGIFNNAVALDAQHRSFPVPAIHLASNLGPIALRTRLRVPATNSKALTGLVDEGFAIDPPSPKVRLKVSPKDFIIGTPGCVRTPGESRSIEHGLPDVAVHLLRGLVETIFANR